MTNQEDTMTAPSLTQIAIYAVIMLVIVLLAGHFDEAQKDRKNRKNA